MEFLTALNIVFHEQDKLTRPAWPRGCYIYLVNGALRLHNEQGDHVWDIGEADFFACDWEVVDAESG